MAERRMFAKSIVESDAFLDMPLSTQALYFHLGMIADDDGFVNSPKKVVRMISASEDDLNLLVLKRFILTFESGIIVIKHWKMNNYIPKDRYKESVYTLEKSQLQVKENSSYTECIQTVYKMDTQDRIGKDRLDKESIDKSSSSINNINNNIANDSCADGLQNVSDSCDDGLHDIIDFYNKNIRPITPYEAEFIKSYLDDGIAADVITYACQLAAEAKVKRFNYIKAILNNWLKAGIKTLDKAKEEHNLKYCKIDKDTIIDEIFGGDNG